MDLCVLKLGEGSLRSVQGNHLSLEIERRELAVLEPLAKVRVFGLVCSGGGEVSLMTEAGLCVWRHGGVGSEEPALFFHKSPSRR